MANLVAGSTDIDSDIEALSINLRSRKSNVSNTNSCNIRSKSEVRPRGHKGKSSCSSPDDPFTNKERESRKKCCDILPQCTSQWNIYTLESLGVYYCKTSIPISNILDMIYDQTGMFGPLTPLQKEYVKSIQDQVTFSYSISDLQQQVHPVFHYIDKTRNGLNLKRDIQIQQLFPCYAEDFTTSTVIMLVCYEETEKAGIQVPKKVFLDLFRDFIKMCGLMPSSGDAWKAKFKLLQRNITSTSDIVILAGDIYESLLTAVSVVSIVELGSVSDRGKNKLHRKTKPVRKASGSDVSKSSCYGSESSNKAESDVSSLSGSCDSQLFLHEEPAIYKSIKKDVLAQHAGELMGHSRAYGHRFVNPKNENELHPGMIVVGTKVTFTLLEYNHYHIKELKEKLIADEERSYIYYSEPKDILKKGDRDQLLETFARLRNLKK